MAGRWRAVLASLRGVLDPEDVPAAAVRFCAAALLLLVFATAMPAAESAGGAVAGIAALTGLAVLAFAVMAAFGVLVPPARWLAGRLGLAPWWRLPLAGLGLGLFVMLMAAT